MKLRSSVEIYDLKTRTSRVVWQTERLVESPHFTPDGLSLILNSAGRMYRLNLKTREVSLIDTGFAVICNNDHGLSKDGRTLIITDKSEFGKACIYSLPIEGGEPVRITQNLSSYYHGWSPDGSRITYTGIHQRDVFGIYTSRVDGTDEVELVVGTEVNDGPDFSADGQWVWFNSNRSGQMQLWRIRIDGTGLELMSDNPYADWFPHPSPDGRHVVFLSYDTSVGRDHPRDQTVQLRLMPSEGGQADILVELFGGQGTINVPSWTAVGDAFAYIRYFPEI